MLIVVLKATLLLEVFEMLSSMSQALIKWRLREVMAKYIKH